VSITLKSTIDGLIYALLTVGTFGWSWRGSDVALHGAARIGARGHG
jgi:hypothetical protein